MKGTKVFVFIFSVLSFVISAASFIAVCFVPTDDPYFVAMLALLNLSKVFLAVGLIFFVTFAVICLCKSKIKNAKKLRSAVSVIAALGVIAACSFAVIGYASVNEYWVTQQETEEYGEVKAYLPYHEIFKNSADDSESVIYEVYKISAGRAVKYVSALNLIPYSANFKAEYLEAKSPLIRYKYLTDRIVPSVFNDEFIDVEAPGVDGELDAIKYRLFENDSDYSIAITDENFVYYAVLLDSEELGISAESFVKTAVGQLDILKNAAGLDLHKFQ